MSGERFLVTGAFIAAARAGAEGATVHNLAGPSVAMADLVAAIAAAAPGSAGRIAFDDVLLPFPGVVDAASLAALVGAVPETPFPDAVADAVARFRDLIARGLVDPTHTLR